MCGRPAWVATSTKRALGSEAGWEGKGKEASDCSVLE